MSEETPSIAAPEQNAIAETGSITAKTSRGTIHCITIVGQIEGHMELPAQNKTTKYEHLIPQIAAVEQTDEIDGRWFCSTRSAAMWKPDLPIAELIAGMKKPTVSLVLGRRAFDRCTAGRCRQKELYRRFRRHDHSSRCG